MEGKAEQASASFTAHCAETNQVLAALTTTCDRIQFDLVQSQDRQFQDNETIRFQASEMVDAAAQSNNAALN